MPRSVDHLPATPEDIPYPPGDPWSLRRAAADMRSTIADLDRARVAATHVDAICDGAHWRGQAFDVFRASVERKPLPGAIDHAQEQIWAAAAHLDAFASRLEDTTAAIGHCRSRLRELTARCVAPGPEAVVELRHIAADADDAWASHRDSLADLAAVFDRLDDEPTYAEPPPSSVERTTGFIGDVAAGAWDATFEMGRVSLNMTALVFPPTAEWQLKRLWRERDQIVAVLDHAWENPADFALVLGKGVIDADTWTEDGIGRWIGHRIPDLLISLTTVGLGKAGFTVASVAAELPGIGTVMRLGTRLERLGRRFVGFVDDIDGDLLTALERAAIRLDEVVDARLDDLGETLSHPDAWGVLEHLLISLPPLSRGEQTALSGVVDGLDRLSGVSQTVDAIDDATRAEAAGG